MNLTEFLDSSADRWPDKAALIEEDSIISYADLARQTAAFASQLQALRLPPGARVGLSFPNSVAYVALTFALWRLQLIVVPIPTECTPEEISDLCASMQLAGILSQKSGTQSTRVSAECFFHRLTPAAQPDNHGLNIAFIRFTSGTTNSRKGVVLSHETIRDRVLTANKALGIGPDDTVMWCLPMSHHFLITIVLYLSRGASIVLARHVVAQPFLEAVERWRGTVLYATPFQYALLARDTAGANLSSVRLAVSTTCPLPQDVAEDFLEQFRIPLVQALGIIELGLVSLNSHDPQGRWDSVGRPLSDHRVRIAAPDADGFGELTISGPGFFDAYAAPWLSRAQVLRDGWFVTGDIGRVDEDGFLFLAGRKTAVINFAGRKVFAEEIEAVLNRHPAVRECRVYGRPHQHLGEVIEGDVVLTQPDASVALLRDFCRANLAGYKIPSQLNVVSALPRTATTRKLLRPAPVA
jgi:long-chain acyl-CoA synthetase